MAERNPIRYQDLISPDDSIEKLISQLENLEKVYTGMATKIRTEAQGVAESLKKVSGATEDGRKHIKSSNEEAMRLEKAYKQLDAALSTNAKEIARLNAVKREANTYNKMLVQRGQEEIRTSKQIKEASYQQLTAQYSLNKAYINSLTATDRKIDKNKELIRSTKEIYDQMKKLQADTGKMQLNVGNYPQIGSMLGGFGRVAGMFGATASAGLLLANTIKDNVALARDYEKALSGLAAILGTTKQGVEDLNEQAQHLGATTIFTAKEVVELQTELAKLGYTVNDIQNMAPSVLNFAQATGSSLADAASLTGAALRMFEKDTTSTTEFVDKMTASTTKSALSFSYLQNAMSTVAPVANAFGFKIEEVLALLGQLANAGFDASSAATATRNILLNLADTNGKLAKQLGEPVKNLDDLINGLKNLNEQGVDLNTTLELTDKRSVAAFNTFLKGTDNAIQLRNELANCDGAAKQMAETMGDNLDGSLKSLNSAWEGFNLHINQSNGLLKSFIDWLKDTVVWLDNTFTAAGRVQRELNKLQGGGDGKQTKTETWLKNLSEVSDSKRESMYNRQVQEFWRYINAKENEIKRQQRKLDDLSTTQDPTGTYALAINSRIEKLKEQQLAAKKMLKEYQRGAEGILKATTGTTTTTTRTTTSTTTTGRKGGEDDTNKQLKEQEQAEKQSLELRRKYEDMMLELVTDEAERERLAIQYKYDRQVEDLRIKLEKDNELHKLSVEDIANINNQIEALEKIKNAKLVEAADKRSAAILAKAEKQRQEEERQRQMSVREQQHAIDIQYQIQMEEIEQLETSEKEKTRMRLEAEKERLQKLLALYKADGKTLTEAEAQLIQKQIDGIDVELGKNKKSGDIYDMLGFKLTDEQKEGINTSISFAMDGLNQFMEAYTAAADKKRELADAEVERTQNVLQAELEARAKGYANDVKTAREEVDEAKKNQQKAIENQRKAQKVQIALDTAMQAANLVTATTTILKLGFPWFIPALAVMWGTFAAAKIKALQAVSAGSDEKYAEGHVELLEGGSHQSGNDIDLGRKANGQRRRAEGGEFFAVINKRSSRKYRSVIPNVINALNNGTFADKYMNAYDGGNAMVMQPIVEQQDLSQLNDNVQRIREQGERTIFVDGQGRTVMIYKNVRRIIKS